MEFIKDWALSVCMACVCVGLLQQFTASRSNFSVIKLVLSLYILITAFAPLGNVDSLNTDLTYDLPNASETQLDTEQLIVQTATQNINTTILNAINAVGCEVDYVKTQVHVTDNYVYVLGVEVSATQNTDVQAVKQAVLNTLQTDVPINITGG